MMSDRPAKEKGVASVREEGRQGELICPNCGAAIGNGYQITDTRPVRANDGTVYCSSKCLWRDVYIVRRGLGESPRIPAR